MRNQHVPTKKIIIPVPVSRGPLLPGRRRRTFSIQGGLECHRVGDIASIVVEVNPGEKGSVEHHRIFENDPAGLVQCDFVGNLTEGDLGTGQHIVGGAVIGVHVPNLDRNHSVGRICTTGFAKVEVQRCEIAPIVRIGKELGFDLIEIVVVSADIAFYSRSRIYKGSTVQKIVQAVTTGRPAIIGLNKLRLKQGVATQSVVDNQLHIIQARIGIRNERISLGRTGRVPSGETPLPELGLF